MSRQHDVQGGQAVDDKRSSLKRRGLIAGAAALVATALASKATVQEVSAADGAAVLLGGGNPATGAPQTETRTTWIAATPATTSEPAFRATNGVGTVTDPAANGTPDAIADGVQGFTFGAGTAGVFGRNNQTNGVGTWGEAPNGTGAFGESTTGSGVAGSSGSGAGVFAQSTSGNGLFGSSSSNVGVFGRSDTSYGVLGASASAHGVTGTTSAPGFAGLIGQAGGNNTTALSGVVAPGTTGTFAAQFSGPVLVSGSFVVSGGPKSAAAKHKDGNLRLLYCVEAPESWFEDFGEAKLVNGKAEVALDPEFAGCVDTGSMHVFITEHEQNNALHVSNRSGKGFTVEADAQTLSAKGKKAADVSGTFSYRVVAKRGDITSARLAKFDMPTLQGVTIPKPPKPSVPPSRLGKK